MIGVKYLNENRYKKLKNTSLLGKNRCNENHNFSMAILRPKGLNEK